MILPVFTSFAGKLGSALGFARCWEIPLSLGEDWFGKAVETG
jgi:hypothetical protein